MSRSVIIAGLIVGSLVFPQAVQAQAASTQPGRDRPGAAPPGTHGVPGELPCLRPAEIEKRIPREQREAMGLDEPTWLARGKAHPDVWAVLETGEMPWLRFKGYVVEPIHGTAYVAVYLRHEQQGERTSKENQAAIKKVQSRVLSRLTAAEFSTFYAFKNTAGLLGFVSKDGLTKLENDADVIAIGLDDKPLPEDAPRARRRSWEHQGGDGNAKRIAPQIERIGKIEADVYDALKESRDGNVYVVVSLQSIPWLEVGLEEGRAAAKAMHDHVLSTLSADEFRLTYKGGAGLTGYVNSAGLGKLDKHTDVWGVGMTSLHKVSWR